MEKEGLVNDSSKLSIFFCPKEEITKQGARNRMDMNFFKDAGILNEGRKNAKPPLLNEMLFTSGDLKG